MTPINRRQLLLKALSLSFLTTACTKDKIIGLQNDNLIKRGIRFAVASDGHYGQPGTDFVTNYLKIIHGLNEENNKKRLDFCVFNGDIIHDNSEFLLPVKEMFKNLNVPYYVTRGNHDQVNNKLWKETWGYSPNHSFELGEYGFILLDTSNEKGEYISPDETWVTDQLNKFYKKNNIFIFMHIPQSSGQINNASFPGVMNLLAKTSSIKAIFHGHDHNQDSIKYFLEKSFFFNGRFGGNWGLPYKGYRIVESENNVTFTTSQYNIDSKLVMNSHNF